VQTIQEENAIVVVVNNEIDITSENMAVLFDLDFTLIDSSLLVELRQTKQQHAAYQMIPQIQPYGGIHELLQALSASKIQIAIVTSSRKPFCDRLIAHLEWSIDTLITRQDVRLPKPHPAGILIALQQLNIQPEDAIMVGDSGDDINAAKAANVYSIGALWGSPTPDLLMAANPDRSFQTVRELHDFLLNNRS
jgi:HAD superfamily hydrolase (TIGR01509 family)